MGVPDEFSAEQVLDEVRVQQPLTNAASIRGRTREVLPEVVRPIGGTVTDLPPLSARSHREQTPAIPSRSCVRSADTSSRH